MKGDAEILELPLLFEAVYLTTEALKGWQSVIGSTILIFYILARFAYSLRNWNSHKLERQEEKKKSAP